MDLRKRLWRQECGADQLEYALLLMLIALGCVAGIANFGKPLGGAYRSASNRVVAGSSGQQGGGGDQDGGRGHRGGGGDQGADGGHRSGSDH